MKLPTANLEKSSDTEAVESVLSSVTLDIFNLKLLCREYNLKGLVVKSSLTIEVGLLHVYVLKTFPLWNAWTKNEPSIKKQHKIDRVMDIVSLLFDGVGSSDKE